MRILIDVLHPAHVHFFRNFVREMEGRGHEFRITVRAKDRNADLLLRYGLPHVRVSAQGSGPRPTPVDLLKHTRGVARNVREFRPDVLTGIMGPGIALAGKLRRVPSVVFYDTEFAAQTNRFVYPLAHSVCTPDCYEGRVRGRQVTYAGYHELAYLHPNRFTPDKSKLAPFGVDADESYAIVRFVSWQAIHDKGERALSAERKREVVALLERYGRVLVSSEAALPDDLEKHALRGPVEDIHHLLAFAKIVVGESATMASEAAVLGVPAVYIAKTGRGYIADLERRYGLVRHIADTDFPDAVRAIETYLERGAREFGATARAKLLEEKIDVTAWMIDYFESSFS